jgi:hypothetical protein
VLLWGIWSVPLAIMQPDLSLVPGDYGDARLNNYFLEHGHRYFTFQIRKYWDAPFMFPQANTMAFSDNLLGTLPIYMLFRGAGAERETAFQLWIIALFALNYISMAWVARRITHHWPLISAVAFVFAFNILLQCNIYNVQMLPRFAVPLVLYWLGRLFQVGHIRYLALVVGGVVWQFYCGMYLGVLLVLACLTMLVAQTMVRKASAFHFIADAYRPIFTYPAILLCGALAMLPLIGPYLAAADIVQPFPFADTLNSVPVPGSYFYSGTISSTWQFMHGLGLAVPSNWWVHVLFMGALPWLALLFAPLAIRSIEPDQRPAWSVHAIGLVLLILITININGFSIYQYIYQLPGFGSIRGLHRIINIEIGFFCLLMVLVGEAALRRWPTARWVMIGLIPLALIDQRIDAAQVNTYAKAQSQADVAYVRQRIKDSHNQGKRAVACVPAQIGPEGCDFNGAVDLHLTTMLASQELGVYCVNAYTGYQPAQYNDFFTFLSQNGLHSWLMAKGRSTTDVQVVPLFAPETVSTRVVALQSRSGSYLSSDPHDPLRRLEGNRPSVSSWERFRLFATPSSAMLLTHDGHAVSVQDHWPVAQRGMPDSTSWFTVKQIDAEWVTLYADDGRQVVIGPRGFLELGEADDTLHAAQFQMIDQ